MSYTLNSHTDITIGLLILSFFCLFLRFSGDLWNSMVVCCLRVQISVSHEKRSQRQLLCEAIFKGTVSDLNAGGLAQTELFRGTAFKWCLIEKSPYGFVVFCLICFLWVLPWHFYESSEPKNGFSSEEHTSSEETLREQGREERMHLFWAAGCFRLIAGWIGEQKGQEQSLNNVPRAAGLPLTSFQPCCSKKKGTLSPEELHGK